MKPEFKTDVLRVDLQLTGAAPYSQSRYLDPVSEYPKKDKETPDAYDIRLWKEKGHYNGDGFMVIPALQIKNALPNAAKYLGEKVKGNATFTKHFKSGILMLEDFLVTDLATGQPIHKDNVTMDVANVRTQKGTMITARYPVVFQWSAQGSLLIVDPTITKDAFTHHLVQCGMYVGIGRFRVGNGGLYGRFAVEDIAFTAVN